MILRSAVPLTGALGLRILLSILPALGGAFVLPMEDVANVTLALALVTPVFLASAMGIPQRVSTGDYGAGRYDQLQVARFLVGMAALPMVLLLGFAFPMVGFVMLIVFFMTRLFEGQAEISTAILTRQDRPLFIAVTYGLLVVAYLIGLVRIAGMEAGRVEALLAMTVCISAVAFMVLHLAANPYHDRTAIKGRLLSRSLFEIRKGYMLGAADGVLSLVSYLPRYLLSAIGLHLLQGAFAIAQLLIRQFTIPTQGLLFARGGQLFPHKASDRSRLDRFLVIAAAMAAAMAAFFMVVFWIARSMPWFERSILAQLSGSQMLLSILVGAIFLLRFATWLLATRFLKGAQQLRIAIWSGVSALMTAMLMLVMPRFELALATDVVANLVIVILSYLAISRRVEGK